MDRRTFIEKSVLGAAAVTSSLYIPSIKRDRKIKVGLIGAGWYGMVISEAALNVGGLEIIGVCDVDSEHLRESADELENLQGIRPQTFKYYQDLLEMDGLEAVFIATPPHWHALQFIAACEKGLDIFCEKPLSYDPMEGLAMIRAAEQAGNVVQIGFQRRHSEAFQHAKQFIADGNAGNIHQIEAQIHYRPDPGERVIQEPPASLDWDEWCGPAPKLDYSPNIGHFNWRYEKEFGNGHLVDWGIHHIDIIRTVMDEKMPTEFKSTGDIRFLKNRITTPDTMTAHMAFEKAPVIWNHRLWGTGDAHSEFNNGIFFYGDQATIFVSESRFLARPADQGADPIDLNIQTEGGMQERHMADFLEAVRSKDPQNVTCTPEDSFSSTSSVLLAMIAYETNSIVKWDNDNKTIIDNPEAARLLKREYRGDLQHPWQG